MKTLIETNETSRIMYRDDLTLHEKGMIACYLAGMRQQDICQLFGVCVKTLYNTKNRAGVPNKSAPRRARHTGAIPRETITPTETDSTIQSSFLRALIRDEIRQMGLLEILMEA